MGSYFRAQRIDSSRSIVFFFCVAFSSYSTVVWAVDESTTLLLYNSASPDSVAIRDKYLQIHPGTRILSLNLPGIGEEILAQTYLDQIRSPVHERLTHRPWGDQIDTIVTTKGLPLRIDSGSNSQTDWQRYSSLESELTRLDSISSVEEMGNQSYSAALANVPGVLPANPYYLGPEQDPVTYEVVPYDGPEGFDRSDPINESIRLVSRLDGFTVDDVLGMLDRAQSSFLVPIGHTVVVDEHPASPVSAETAMTELAVDILPAHAQLTDYDQTNSPITSVDAPVIGYVSHGTHSGLPGGVPGNLDDTGYLVTSLDFQYANGAVFHTYESFNAYSFDPDSSSSVNSQGQVAQWIAVGGTAGLGHVQEPTASKWTVTNEDIFFDMMLSGYTLAESAWAATRQLSFVNTVVGDPLMRWIPWLPGDVNLDGVIDNADIGLLFGNWEGAGTSFADGDINGDGAVNAIDAGILFGNWDSPPSMAAFTSFSVPEPTSALLAILSLGGMLAIRRRLTGSMPISRRPFVR